MDETISPVRTAALFAALAAKGESAEEIVGEALSGRRDQVLLAMGHPDHKSREVKDGMELEDWIFGQPPGKITFVTFNGSKVIKVKEEYAGLGTQVADPKVPR